MLCLKVKGPNDHSWRFIAGLMIALMLGGCDWWPQNLSSLEQSIARLTGGEVTAWRVSGDAVVISVEASNRFQEPDQVLEALATDIVAQALKAQTDPVESVIITFYQNQITDDPAQMRDYVYLVNDGIPVLQPDFDFYASGPLSTAELEMSLDQLGDAIAEDQRPCVLEQMQQRAKAAGDPETLAAESLPSLPAEQWQLLDAFGKRLILTQVITTDAMFACLSQG